MKFQEIFQSEGLYRTKDFADGFAFKVEKNGYISSVHYDTPDDLFPTEEVLVSISARMVLESEWYQTFNTNQLFPYRVFVHFDNGQNMKFRNPSIMFECLNDLGYNVHNRENYKFSGECNIRLSENPDGTPRYIIDDSVLSPFKATWKYIDPKMNTPENGNIL